MHKALGFTLVEAVMAIIILMILIAVSVPPIWDTILAYQAASSAQKLALDLEYDKQTTRRTVQEYPATFDGTAGTYSIPLADPMGTGNISGPINGCKAGWTGILSFDIGGTPKVNGVIMTSDLAIDVWSSDANRKKTVKVTAYRGDIEVYP